MYNSFSRSIPTFANCRGVSQQHSMFVHYSRVIVCVWLLSSVSSLPLHEPHSDCQGISPPVCLHRSRRNVLSAGYSFVRRAWRPSFIRRLTAMRSLWGSLALKAEEESIRSLHMPNVKHIPGVKQGRESLVKRIKNYFYKMKPGTDHNPAWGSAAAEEAMKSLPLPNNPAWGSVAAEEAMKSLSVPEQVLAEEEAMKSLSVSNVEQIPVVKEQREGILKRMKNYVSNKIKSMANGGIATLVKDTVIQVGIQRAMDAVSNWLDDQQTGQSQEDDDETPRRVHYQQQGIQRPHLQQMTQRDPLQQATYVQQSIQNNQLQQGMQKGQLEHPLEQATHLQQSRDPLQQATHLQQSMQNNQLQPEIQKDQLEPDIQTPLLQQMSQKDPLQVLQQVMKKGPLQQNIQQTNLEQDYQKELSKPAISLHNVATPDSWMYWNKPEFG
uniref:Uncharacterized protein n=1 Tax=Cacopsylla melanoneura TaxID=428564 RepID=A0A8D8VDA8_9HEMI